ncbi:MAG: 4Fe-4S dicluster domain-containing protein [Burkholderiaceae bacterium]
MKPHSPPPPEAVAVYAEPPRSGNDVNGLGVSAFFKPQHVFHSNPGYYGVHDWFLMNAFFRLMASWRAIPQSLLIRWHTRNCDGPVAAEQQSVDDPVAMTDLIKAIAKDEGAAIVGIARVTDAAYYEHTNLDYPTAICFGMPMDRGEMAAVPQDRAAVEVLRVYKELAITGNQIAARIRQMGWRAKSFADSNSTDILQIPLAIDAGLGELGKHGSLICPDYGSNIRLAAVLTDLPLVPDKPVDIGVQDLCISCKRCTIDCPPNAISDETQMVRGTRKWYVDFDKCTPYFSITGGCAICIQVCPFSEDGRAPKLSDQLLRRRARKLTEKTPAVT